MAGKNNGKKVYPKMDLNKVPKLRIFLYICLIFNFIWSEYFSKSTLRDFWELYPDSAQYLKTWYDAAMNTDWNTPNDVNLTNANAGILKERRIVFNIKGNTYRLVAMFNFEKKWIFIRFIGTRSEYNKIDANTI
jgi:mRNA interferase HigB